MMKTVEVFIDIRPENPSGYAGDDTAFYVQCPKNSIDAFMVALDEAVNKVLKEYNLD